MDVVEATGGAPAVGCGYPHPAPGADRIGRARRVFVRMPLQVPVQTQKEQSVRRAATWVGAISVVAAFAAPASALGATQITAKPLLGGKLGGAGTLTVNAQATDSLGGIPSPLTQLVIDIPPGPTYNFATTPLCSVAVVKAATGSTPPSCPAGSKIGSGSAEVEAALGTTTLQEPATLDIYLTSRSPVVAEVWANGTTPVEETLAFPGTFTPTAAPFAEKITVNVPPIQIPGAPDASVVSLDFTLGGTHTVTTTKTVKRGKRNVKVKVKTTVGLFNLPKSCPGGSLSYAANATFEDGSNPGLTGKVACP